MANDTPWKCKRCQTTGQIEDTCETCGSPPDWVPTPPPRNVPTPEQEAAEAERLRLEREKAEADDAAHRAKLAEVKQLEKKKFDDTITAKVSKPVEDALAVINPLAAKLVKLEARIDALEAAGAVKGDGK